MYYVNKVVGWIASPFGIFFIGMGVAYVLKTLALRREPGDRTRRRLRRASKALSAVLMVFLWFISTGVALRLVGPPLESSWVVEGKPHGTIDGLPDADAIVVLGGGMGVHLGCGAPEMYGSADRVWQGAKLYKAGKSRLVALSGIYVEQSTVPLLVDLGVPKEAMVYFNGARNTEEESKLIYERLGRDVKGRRPRILLVTSAWHMSRAKLLFDRAGFEVVPAPTDFEMSNMLESDPEIWDLLPSVDALQRISYAVKEWVGNFGYRFLRR